jgi:hypothetical protein
LLVMLKMHFYQVLIPNVDASFMTWVMQLNDLYIFPIITYIIPMWTINVFITIEMQLSWKKSKMLWNMELVKKYRLIRS